METPPPLQEPKPLGRTFYIILFSPIAAMALAVGIGVAGGRNGAGGDLGVPLSFLALFAMLVCSIICAVMVGKRKGGGIGFLAFLGIQILYIGVAFAGCVTLADGMSFR